jgi:hypothetical protein
MAIADSTHAERPNFTRTTMIPQDLLASFGVSRTPGYGVTVVDQEKAETAYIHHSAVPVAVVALSLCSMDIARLRFPNYRLVDLVAKRPAMDDREARALADVCNAKVEMRFTGSALAPAFNVQLLHVIDRYQLGAFFTRDANRAINGIDVRPLGFDPRSGQVDPVAMAAWRRAYKALPAPEQMMVATIIWLYRGGPDKTWLNRLPCKWYATDAVLALGFAGMGPDWGKLVALYPGW